MTMDSNLTLFSGTDDNGQEWADVCRGETDIAKFFGKDAEDHARAFMGTLTVAATARKFIDDYNAALDAKELCPNGDDFQDLCTGLRDVLWGYAAPEISLTSEGR